MSKLYTVRAGDSFSKIAAAQYGDGSKAVLIAKANPQVAGRGVSLEGFPYIYAGDKLTIPDIFGPRTPQEVDAAFKNELTLMIDGVAFTSWETATITRSFDTIADSFTMTTPWDPMNTEHRKTFQPFSYKPFSLFIGGDQIMSGIIITHQPETAANKNKMTVSGYSYAGVLADVGLPLTLWPFEPDGLNLYQILELFAGPFDIHVVKPTLSEAFEAFSDSERVDMQPEQKIYDFLISLVHQRGIVLSSNNLGKLIVQKATTVPADITIRAGHWPFVKSGATYDGQSRFSSITVIGTEAVDGAGEVATIEDPALRGILVPRPHVIKAPDTSAGSLRAAAVAEYGRGLAQATGYNVTVANWLRPDKKGLWRDNTKMFYYNPGDMVYEETELLIREVQYTRAPETETTSLSLVFPECYNGEVRERFPWD
jgi:prophage tail gpP-like protein